MFCKFCGKQIDNDSIFCSFCGTKQSTDLKPQVQTEENFSHQHDSKTFQPAYKTENNFTSSPNVVRQPKYDPTYKKEDDAMTVGIILLVIAIFFVIVGPIQFEDSESYGQFKAITAIVSLILRIIITIWVVNIAKRQNRETFGWGLFAFFLPSIALIVIATRKKLFANIQIIEGLDNEQNSKILSDKAQEFYNDNKYSESIRFSEKAIELNPENEIAKEVLKKSKVAFTEANNLSSSVQTVFRETTDGRLLKIISKLNQTIGANVFIDDILAPDGVYNYKSGTHKLVIEDGKIKERYFINRFNKFYIEQAQEHMPTKGDNVFLITGEPAPTGKYSLGLLNGNVIVENGKFIKW